MHGYTETGANVAEVAKEFLTPLIGYMKTNYTVFVLNPSSIQVPAEYSLFKLNSNLILSAAKKAENAEALIIRVIKSPQEKNEGGQIVLNNSFSKVFTSDLQEQCNQDD